MLGFAKSEEIIYSLTTLGQHTLGELFSIFELEG